MLPAPYLPYPVAPFTRSYIGSPLRTSTMSRTTNRNQLIPVGCGNPLQVWRLAHPSRYHFMHDHIYSIPRLTPHLFLSHTIMFSCTNCRSASIQHDTAIGLLSACIRRLLYRDGIARCCGVDITGERWQEVYRLYGSGILPVATQRHGFQAVSLFFICYFILLFHECIRTRSPRSSTSTCPTPEILCLSQTPLYTSHPLR